MGYSVVKFSNLKELNFCSKSGEGIMPGAGDIILAEGGEVLPGIAQDGADA